MGFRTGNPLLAKARYGVAQNKALQLFIFISFTLIIFIYGSMLSYSMSIVHYSVTRNTEILESDYEIEEIESYEVEADGSAEIKLMSGNKLMPNDVTFAFYENKGTEKAYYDRDSKTILMELDKNYSWTFLIESSYFIILPVVLVATVFAYMLKNRNWAILSNGVVRLTWTGLLVGVLLVGGLTLLMI